MRLELFNFGRFSPEKTELKHDVALTSSPQTLQFRQVLRPRCPRYLRIFLLTLCLGILPSCKTAVQTPAEPKLKRILLITIDTLRADALSIYGNKTRTPFFEELAQRSVVFDNAFTCVPITLPAHASLLSGLYPPSHGVRNNGTFRAPAELHLLSKYAKENQFATAAVIGGFPLSAQFGLNQGFDFYDDQFPKQQSAPGIYLFAEKNAEQVRKSAESWLSQHSNDSFFLWMHFFDPHHPYVDHGMTGIPSYEQEVLYVDQQLGLFFQYLRQHRMDDQLLTIVTADHGEAFGEHGEISHSVFVYNTTLRIPLLVSVPGKTAGRRKNLARIIDVAPTVMDIFQWKIKNKMEGVPLVPLLEGKQLSPQELYAETLAPALDFAWSPLLSIQNLDSKFILAPRSEFYDLKQDPDELQNKIAGVNPDSYRKKIHEISARAPISKNTSHTPSPEEREQLESLGYFSGAAILIPANAPDPKDRIQVARMIAELTGEPTSLQGKEQAYRKIAKQEPSNPLLLLRYGEVLLKLQKYSEAEQVFQRVLDLEYPYVDVYNGLATVYFYQNQPAKAENILNQALKLNLADGETYYNLAEFKFNKGDSAGAMIYYDRSIEFGFVPAFLRKARLLEIKGESDEALRVLQKGEDAAPNDARFNMDRGILLARNKKLPEAIAEFEKGLQKDPEAKHLLYNIGLCYYRMGEKEKARGYLREFLNAPTQNFKEERSAAQQMMRE